ncbi:MAG: YdeI/OmpD-associated family protein [Rhodothermales bacterium]
MSEEITYDFNAPLLKSINGFLKQHYAPVPVEIAEAVIKTGSRRVIVVINGKTIRRAVQNSKHGEFFMLLGQSLLKEIGVVLGDDLAISLKPDPDPDFVELGEEFAEVLEMDEAASTRFFSFTPGKQRGLATHVNGAKREETRIKRALEIAHKIKTFTLYDDRKSEE